VQQYERFVACHSGKTGSTCCSPMCPVCHRRRVKLFTRKLLLGISRPGVGALLVTREDRVEPFERRQYLEQKAHAGKSVDFSKYSQDHFRTHLEWTFDQEQKRMITNANNTPNAPLGVLSMWYAWPLRYGWHITRVRFTAYHRAEWRFKPTKQPRYERLVVSSAVVRDFSPGNISKAVKAAMRQPQGLSSDDLAILPAAGMLMSAITGARRFHVNGVFIGLQQNGKRVPKLPQIEKLHSIGITVGSQQEFWLLEYVRMTTLFPEITWAMFCDRLEAQAIVDPTSRKTAVPDVVAVLALRSPDAKLPARVAFLSEYCTARDFMLAQHGQNLPLNMFLSLQTQLPAAETPVLPFVAELPPITSAMTEVAPFDVATPQQVARVETPPAATATTTDAPRKRKKAAQEPAESSGAGKTRVRYRSHSVTLAADVLQQPTPTTKGVLMTDDGQLVYFSDQEVVADDSIGPVLPPTAEHYSCSVSADVADKVHHILGLGKQPDDLTGDLPVVALRIDNDLQLDINLAAEDPPFIDGFVHNPNNLGNDQQAVPVAEVAPRFYSAIGRYVFNLGSRVICVTVTLAAPVT
jgi:hypothetical protein